MNDRSSKLETACFSRRQFLIHGGWVTALAIFVYQVGRFLGTPDLDAGSSRMVDAGSIDDFIPGQYQFVAGARAWMRREDDRLRALDAVCPHLGCIVRQAKDASGFYCPCHGSRFSAEGVPVQGPADSPLRELFVQVQDGTAFMWTE